MPITPLFRKLDSIARLRGEDKDALASLPLQIMQLRADQDVVREGDRTSRCCILLEGFACTFKLTGEGKRQIIAFHIAGDVPDLQSLHLRLLDSSIGTLAPSTVAFVRHEDLIDLCTLNPAIASALWRSTLIDAAIFREWVTNVGQRAAYNRVSHVLCEIVTRLGAIGRGDNGTFDHPITQSELGDATGLSVVHINRVLKKLRDERLIALTGTKLTILNWDGLQLAGDFDPAYLHLVKAA
jgi:CRP-like cAMP-binding protein